MEAIVQFFDKFVSEFSWKRLGLVVSLLAIAFVSVWVYELYTGHFKTVRMQFAAEHLAKRSSPELKKNIQGDEELEKTHRRLKGDLNQFVEGTQLDLGVPEPILKAVATAFPWFLLGLVMFLVSDRQEFGKVAGGLAVVAIPFHVLGALLPTQTSSWINYVLYPFGVVLIIMGAILLWQRLKTKTV